MQQRERSERSRAQILEAALRLFSHQGYRGTSIRETSEPAGISPGNLYHQFPDKETIFDPFALLRQLLADYRPAEPACVDLPSVGGALGYFGYDLARRIERLPAIAEDVFRLPELAVGIYAWAVIVDHVEQRTRLVWNDLPDAPSRPAVLARLRGPREAPARPAFRVRSPITSNLDAADYGRAFARIQTYIRDGDCYQVNLARRFSAAADGDPWPAYRRLRAHNPSPFGAYLHLPFCHVLSASPERFLALQHRSDIPFPG